MLSLLNFNKPDIYHNITKYVENNTNIRKSVNTIINTKPQSSIYSDSKNRISIHIKKDECCKTPSGDYFCNPDDLPDVCPNGLNITQTSTAIIKTTTQVNPSVFMEEQKKINDEIISKLEEDLITASDDYLNKVNLKISGNDNKNKQEIISDIINSVNVDMNLNFTNEIVNKIIVGVKQENKFKLAVCGALADSCTIDQSNYADIQVKNYINAISQTVKGNKYITEMKKLENVNDDNNENQDNGNINDLNNNINDDNTDNNYSYYIKYINDILNKYSTIIGLFSVIFIICFIFCIILLTNNSDNNSSNNSNNIINDTSKQKDEL